jgi:hypothetical protein
MECGRFCCLPVRPFGGLRCVMEAALHFGFSGITGVVTRFVLGWNAQLGWTRLLSWFALWISECLELDGDGTLHTSLTPILLKCLHGVSYGYLDDGNGLNRLGLPLRYGVY